jgi:hypothetical protein
VCGRVCVWGCVCVYEREKKSITRFSYCDFVLKISIIIYYEAYRSFTTKCHNSKLVIFQERRLKVLKCCTFV